MNLKKHKLYFATFFTDMLSNFGDTVYSLALMNYVLLVPQKEQAIALVSISESLPILFSILMGYWADQKEKKVDWILYSQISRFALYLLAGFLLQFDPALMLVLALVGINFFSDLAGKFENSLFLPLKVQLLPPEERETLLATTQGIEASSSIVFQFIGAALISWISYSQPAFLNATTFLLAALLTLYLRPHLLKRAVVPVTHPEEKPGLISSIKEALQQMKQTPKMIPLLSILASINGIFSILIPLILATIASKPDFAILSAASTVAGVSIILGISSIFGNILISTLFKNLSLFHIIQATCLLAPLLFLSFLSQLPSLVILCIFFMGILMGCIQPKVSAYFMSHLPIEQLGILSSSISTLLQATILVSQLLFSGLLLSLPLSWILFLLLALAISLNVFLLHNRQKLKD